jgi:hypothetical protein
VHRLLEAADMTEMAVHPLFKHLRRMAEMVMGDLDLVMCLSLDFFAVAAASFDVGKNSLLTGK